MNMFMSCWSLINKLVDSTKCRLKTDCRPLFSGLESNGTIVVTSYLHGEKNSLLQSAVSILYWPYKLGHTLCHLIKTAFKIKENGISGTSLTCMDKLLGKRFIQRVKILPLMFGNEYARSYSRVWTIHWIARAETRASDRWRTGPS